jgi:hypothetical protein
MKSTHHTDLTADKAGISGQVLGSSCRGTEEQIVEGSLVAPSDLPEMSRQCEGEHEEGGGEKQLLLFL